MSHWERSSKSDDWYTPPHVFAALGATFDLDVAGPRGGEGCHVPARRFLYADGLRAIWYGFVWCNPPYGGRNSLSGWIAKFFAHGNGIALTPDRTSAPWFQESWPLADLALFTPKIRFLRPDGSEGRSPSNGTTLWAVGANGRRALESASVKGLGILATPSRVATSHGLGE